MSLTLTPEQAQTVTYLNAKAADAGLPTFSDLLLENDRLRKENAAINAENKTLHHEANVLRGVTDSRVLHTLARLVRDAL